jgi:hypothetical protein
MKRSILFTCLPVIFILTGCQNMIHHDMPAILAFMVIAIIILLFFMLAIYSNILRDEISDCDEFAENARKLQQKQKWKQVNKAYPFSLTKVQFGVWTVIIASSYIYLSFCKGDCADGPINKTALVLMGIFAGTTVASGIIDKKEINDNRPRHQNSPSEGFFVDILSDDSGISLHRFQNFVWTIIAMVIYIYRVYNTAVGCILPELSDTLLTLTGISSATYLVMRSKENDPSIQEARADNSAGNNTAGAGNNVNPVNTLPVQPGVST